MTKNDFLMKMGLVADESENIKVVNSVLEKVRTAFNERFNLNIKVGDYDTLLSQLNKIKVTRDDLTGDATKVSLGFETATKDIVNLNLKLKETKSEIISLQAAVEKGILTDLSTESIKSLKMQGFATLASGKVASKYTPTKYITGALDYSAGSTGSIQVITNTTEKLGQLSAAYKEIESITRKLNAQDEGSELFNEYGKQAEVAKAKIEELKTTLLSLGKASVTEGVAGLTTTHETKMGEIDAVANQKQVNQVYEGTLSLYKRLGVARKELALLENAEAKATDIAKKKDEVSALETQVNSTWKLNEAKNRLTIGDKNLAVSANQVKSVTDAAKEAQAQYNNTIAEGENNVHRLGSSFGSLGKQIKTTAENVIKYKLAYSAFNLVDRAVGQSINKIRELDTFMTQIQMVTGQTNDEVEQLMNSYVKLGQQLGVTALDVSKGAVEWLRQGRSLEETQKLLTASTMLSQVGAMDAADATEKLTA